jgi:hypothetical protein
LPRQKPGSVLLLILPASGNGHFFSNRFRRIRTVTLGSLRSGEFLRLLAEGTGDVAGLCHSAKSPCTSCGPGVVTPGPSPDREAGSCSVRPAEAGSVELRITQHDAHSAYLRI